MQTNPEFGFSIRNMKYEAPVHHELCITRMVDPEWVTYTWQYVYHCAFSECILLSQWWFGAIHPSDGICTGRQVYISFSSPGLENIVTIHAAQSTMFAGSSYTLNCTVMSDLRSVVKWTGLDGNPVETNTSSITVYDPVYNGNKTYLLLRFPALRTSQAGRYTCQSIVSSPLSVRTATKNVVVTGKRQWGTVECSRVDYM